MDLDAVLVYLAVLEIQHTFGPQRPLVVQGLDMRFCSRQMKNILEDLGVGKAQRLEMD